MTVMAAEAVGSRAAAGEASAARSARRSDGRNAVNTAATYTRSSRQFAAPEMKPYQAIILVEFILAELLVAATPIATRQNQPGLSPYIPRDLIKLLAIGMVYFLLELGAVAGHSWGRFGAWFGGLILLTVGLNEGANVTKDLDLFGLQTKAAAKAQNLPNLA